MPPMALSNVGSQFLPPTSHTVRGFYVPVLHNVPQPTPPAVGSGGHVGYDPIGPTLHPTTFDWVPPQQPNIGNQYLSSAQYNNSLYVPYPGGVTNQWDQPTYGPQAIFNQTQPPFMG